jgi:hypothetical protein
MSPGKDYAPCTHCNANNITHRRVCWRCGATLPYTIGLDGKPRSNSDWSQNRTNRAEIERLLDQAQTLDIEQEKRLHSEAEAAASAPAPQGFRPRIWRWLRRGDEGTSKA